MNWKFAGDRPVYQQIMAAIRGAILKGELPPGGKVPSVRDLAAFSSAAAPAAAASRRTKPFSSPCGSRRWRNSPGNVPRNL